MSPNAFNGSHTPIQNKIRMWERLVHFLSAHKTYTSQNGYVSQCLKIPQKVSFYNFTKLKVVVKQCYQSYLKEPKLVKKCQNSNETFWLIFKHYAWKGSSVIGSNIRSQEFSFFPWLLKSSKKGSFFERIIMLELIPQKPPQNHKKFQKKI